MAQWKVPEMLWTWECRCAAVRGVAGLHDGLTLSPGRKGSLGVDVLQAFPDAGAEVKPDGRCGWRPPAQCPLCEPLTSVTSRQPVLVDSPNTRPMVCHQMAVYSEFTPTQYTNARQEQTSRPGRGKSSFRLPVPS